MQDEKASLYACRRNTPTAQYPFEASVLKKWVNDGEEIFLSIGSIRLIG